MELKAGDRVHGYEILGRLGSGGMAVVYRARAATGPDEVALKVLVPRDETEQEAVRRFGREGRIQAELEHPHLVRVLERGSDGDVVFLVLELVQGPSLASLLEATGKLPLGIGLVVARAVTQGLAYIHGLGIVHRDLKPGNILLSWAGDVKIADFGLARSEAVTLMTATHQIMGTLSYLAPEIIRGEPVTPAADRHSLGVILYECFTGRLPFQGANPADWMRQIADHRPVPAGQLEPALPPELAALIDALLAKQPAERPGLEQVLAVLESVGGPADAGLLAEWMKGIWEEDCTQLRALAGRERPGSDRTFARPGTQGSPPGVFERQWVAPERRGSHADGKAGGAKRAGKTAWLLALPVGVAVLAAAALFVRPWSAATIEGPSPAAQAPAPVAVPSELEVEPEPTPSPAPTARDRASAPWREHGEQALAGQVDSMRQIAVAYATGAGLEKAPRAAFEWTLLAAMKGDVPAQYQTALMYLGGQGVEQSPRLAARWMWESARSGYVEGQVALGKMYNSGNGVPRDREKAFAWFKTAADAGHAEGLFRMGLFHEHGWCVPKDPAAAARWYDQALRKGSADAALNLGALLFNGVGVARDPARALRLFEAAGRSGNVQAQRNAAQLFHHGAPGVERNLALAVDWYTKAAAGGDKLSARQLAELNRTGGQRR